MTIFSGTPLEERCPICGHELEVDMGGKCLSCDWPDNEDDDYENDHETDFDDDDNFLN